MGKWWWYTATAIFITCCCLSKEKYCSKLRLNFNLTRNKIFSWTCSPKSDTAPVKYCMGVYDRSRYFHAGMVSAWLSWRSKLTLFVTLCTYTSHSFAVHRLKWNYNIQLLTGQSSIAYHSVVEGGMLYKLTFVRSGRLLRPLSTDGTYFRRAYLALQGAHLTVERSILQAWDVNGQHEIEFHKDDHRKHSLNLEIVVEHLGFHPPHNQNQLNIVFKSCNANLTKSGRKIGQLIRIGTEFP